MKHQTIWLAAALVLSAQTVTAGTISCGVHTIQDGTRVAVTKYELLKKCGEPKHRDGDMWVYEKSGRTIQITFKSGEIANIR